MKRLYKFLVLTAFSICPFRGVCQDNVTENSIILNEEIQIEINGTKYDHVVFLFTCDRTYKILNEKGISECSQITLPESFDPANILHYPKSRNYGNYLSNVHFGYFNASIVSEGDVVKNAQVDEVIMPVKSVIPELNRFGTYDEAVYRIKNLKVGDELNVKYSYTVHYNKNFFRLSSFRLFFNSDRNKLNYKFILKIPKDLETEIYFRNYADPDSIVAIGTHQFYYWDKKNLAGCFDEPGSRPYKSLPHVIFTIMPSQISYMLPYSFEIRYVPFYAIFAFTREKNHLSIAQSIHLGVKLKQYQLIDKFIKEQISDIQNDTLGYFQLMKIHHTIAEQFRFSNDTDYFNRREILEPKLGDNISAMVLRDIFRYDTYVATIMKLGLPYFTTYVADIRSAELNNEYFRPMYDSDYLFSVVIKNNTLQFIYPKKDNFGFYLNEFPFYYEGAKARLVSLNDYQDPRSPIFEEIRQITLPSSKVNDNVRRTTVQGDINVNRKSISFKARILLQGQFSTMMRGLYMQDYKHADVNHLYHVKLWDKQEDVNLKKKDVIITKKEFPFANVVNAEYFSDNMMQINDNILSIDLSNWFLHIIYTDLSENGRVQDFYADFPGRDTYVYSLRFDEPVELINENQNIEIRNEFGEYIFMIEQENETSIRVTSHFAIFSPFLPVEKISFVADMFRAIQKHNENYNLNMKLIKE
jgi:hypothetical protein